MSLSPLFSLNAVTIVDTHMLFASWHIIMWNLSRKLFRMYHACHYSALLTPHTSSASKSTPWSNFRRQVARSLNHITEHMHLIKQVLRASGWKWGFCVSFIDRFWSVFYVFILKCECWTCALGHYWTLWGKTPLGWFKGKSNKCVMYHHVPHLCIFVIVCDVTLW